MLRTSDLTHRFRRWLDKRLGYHADCICQDEEFTYKQNGKYICIWIAGEEYVPVNKPTYVYAREDAAADVRSALRKAGMDVSAYQFLLDAAAGRNNDDRGGTL